MYQDDFCVRNGELPSRRFLQKSQIYKYITHSSDNSIISVTTTLGQCQSLLRRAWAPSIWGQCVCKVGIFKGNVKKVVTFSSKSPKFPNVWYTPQDNCIILVATTLGHSRLLLGRCEYFLQKFALASNTVGAIFS